MVQHGDSVGLLYGMGSWVLTSVVGISCKKELFSNCPNHRSILFDNIHDDYWHLKQSISAMGIGMNTFKQRDSYHVSILKIHVTDYFTHSCTVQ